MTGFSTITTLPVAKTGELKSYTTDASGNFFFNININITTLVNSSQEIIFQTFIHETLHGVLVANGVPWSNVIQHNEIANFYRSYIEDAIKSAFPTLSSAESYALSWAGLQSTNAYLVELPQFWRTDIEIILGKHLYSSTLGGGHLCN